MTDCEYTPAFRKPYKHIYESAAERLDELTAEDILDPLFGGVYWHDAKLKGDYRTGFVDEYEKRYRFWHHRSSASLSADLAALTLLDQEILAGVSNYIEKGGDPHQIPRLVLRQYPHL
jgi:hypothetical protein